MSDTLSASTITITGNDGDEVQAYLARPEGDVPRGGVVVIHHLPGYDRATKEMVRRFAELGYDAVCPNLYWRQAPGAAPDDAAATVRAAGGISDEQLVGDVAGAAAYLRGLPSSNGKVGVIGYCSGGRQTWVVACSLDVDAAVDCYGGRADPELAPNLRCALLGLFGKEDQSPAPDDVAVMAKALDANGKNYEFHSYDDAGHAFFSVDRPSYRLEAAKDGWKRIWAFYGAHLKGE